MKRILFAGVFMCAVIVVRSQNIQLHYDMGKGRGYLTSTVEMFKTDIHGSTFFFIDMDYGSGNNKGVSMAYWEIARGIKFWNNPFEIHVEYNGGFGRANDGSSYGIKDAWLFGGNYTWNTSDFSKIFTIQAMYKYIRGKNKASFQITEVWIVKLLKNKITFDGYADFWREDWIYNPGTVMEKRTKFIFQSEPQIWYNFNSNFAIGNETEVDVNFGGLKGFKVMPTIGAKYTF